MTSVVDGLIEINTTIYFQYDNQDNNKFRIIGGIVWRGVTDVIYNKLVSQKEIEPLENIPQDKKDKYWNVANEFLKDKSKEDKISGSKCCYITEIITSTYE